MEDGQSGSGEESTRRGWNTEPKGRSEQSRALDGDGDGDGGGMVEGEGAAQQKGFSDRRMLLQVLEREVEERRARQGVKDEGNETEGGLEEGRRIAAEGGRQAGEEAGLGAWLAKRPKTRAGGQERFPGGGWRAGP